MAGTVLSLGKKSIEETDLVSAATALVFEWSNANMYKYVQWDTPTCSVQGEEALWG